VAGYSARKALGSEEGGFYGCADSMTDKHMDLLDAGGVFGGNSDKVMAAAYHLAAGFAGKTYGEHT
jgi:hypothetical protein